MPASIISLTPFKLTMRPPRYRRYCRLSKRNVAIVMIVPQIDVVDAVLEVGHHHGSGHAVGEDIGALAAGEACRTVPANSNVSSPAPPTRI